MTRGERLIERKQRQARQRIVAASEDLFAARGFDAVSVTDIAERAEVGRTTFFRHFGDKQEVVFAREQELLDLIATERVDSPGSTEQTATGALQALEPVVLRLCERMTADLEGYRRHVQLVDQHVELRAREAEKMQVVARLFGELLVAHGWSADLATFAGQIALACCWTARHGSAEPAHLLGATRAALAQALQLGTTAATPPPAPADPTVRQSDEVVGTSPHPPR